MGEVSYRPLIEDMVWSYSRIQSFRRCPYAWFQRYIRNDPEEPEFYASYGSFVHELFAEFYTGALSKEDLPEAFANRFGPEVKGLPPKRGLSESYFEEGLKYFQEFEPLPFRCVGVEKELFFQVGGFPFHGFIDFVGEREDGKLVVVDHKSRALKQRSKRKKPTANDREIDSILPQLYLYAEGLHQELGRFPDELCINCFRSGELIQEPFDPALLEQAKEDVIKSINDILDESEFYPVIDEFQCRNMCGFHYDCCYYQGR